MKVLRLLQEICIALIVIHTGAEITLSVVTPLDTLLIYGLDVELEFECGSRVTFVCEIKPYEDQAVWQVNFTTYALCIFQSCFNYPPYPAYHGFSMSLATETFNLTTDPITLAARRSIYSCNDGVTALSVDAIVKVYVKNETLEMDTSQANQITLTTGCVYPYGKNDMTFEWFISKDRVILQQSQFVRDEIQSITAFACAETSDCAGADSVQFNSTVVIDVFDTGDDYHICVAVQHNDEANRPPAVHCSVQTYRVKNYSTNRTPTTFASWIKPLVIHGIPRVIFIPECVLLFFKKKKSNAYFSLAGLFLPGLGILLLNCKKDCCSKTIRICCIASCLVIVLDIVIIVLFTASEPKPWLVWKVIASLYICLVWISSIIKVCSCLARLKCTTCKNIASYMCKNCNTSYCEDCLKTDVCVIEKQMICGSCNHARNEMKTYCCECRQFLCNSCSINHAECKGIILKHLQHGTGREEEIFCETNEHSSRYSAHGYCLGCDCYVCSTCLMSHVDHGLLWIKRHLDAAKDGHCCLTVNTDHTKPSYPGYCFECKLYICLNCSEKHKGEEHDLIVHIPEDAAQDRLCCLRVNTDHTKPSFPGYCLKCKLYICVNCSEKHKGEEHDLIMHIPKDAANNRLCCLRVNTDHTKPTYPGYCLKCKLYICVNCSEKHKGEEHDLIMLIPEDAVKDRLCCLTVNTDHTKLSYPGYCFKCKLYICLICSEKHKGEEHDLSMHIPEDAAKDRLCCLTVNTDHTKPIYPGYCFKCKLYICVNCSEKHKGEEHDLSMHIPEGNYRSLVLAMNICLRQ